jgi:hypothetical protein
VILIRIVAPRFVAGLEADTRVVRAAPILRHLLGMSGAEVAAVCIRRGWRWERTA